MRGTRQGYTNKCHDLDDTRGQLILEGWLYSWRRHHIIGYSNERRKTILVIFLSKNLRAALRQGQVPLLVSLSAEFKAAKDRNWK